VSLIADQSDNHAIEVEEEHDKVETKLYERFLLMHIQFPKNFCRVQKMLVLKNFLSIPYQEWEVQQKRNPVSVDEEKESEAGVDGGFGDDIVVESVAEVDGVDIVTFQVAIHYREEYLQEKVDGVYQDG